MQVVVILYCLGSNKKKSIGSVQAQFFFLNIFDPHLVESWDVEPVDSEDPFYFFNVA